MVSWSLPIQLWGICKTLCSAGIGTMLYWMRAIRSGIQMRELPLLANRYYFRHIHSHFSLVIEVQSNSDFCSWLHQLWKVEEVIRAFLICVSYLSIHSHAPSELMFLPFKKLFTSIHSLCSNIMLENTIDLLGICNILSLFPFSSFALHTGSSCQALPCRTIWRSCGLCLTLSSLASWGRCPSSWSSFLCRSQWEDTAMPRPYRSGFV